LRVRATPGSLKPSTAKGVYLKSATISATMTPGIKLDVQEIGAR
jgi:large subunit ribosomal protein L1